MNLTGNAPWTAAHRPAPAGNIADDFALQLSFLGLLSEEERHCLPDWMVIAPPKTGTTWVSDNIRRHPRIFVPLCKEVKYFSNRFDTEDLRLYLAQFREGSGKSKGEAAPSYSLLPRSTIQLIRRLMPDLKLIFLMRDPIERAWSHARHCFRHGEANFKGRTGHIDDVPESDWIRNLHDDWNQLCGDYLGQLQRWLSVFPKEQMFLGFFDDVVSTPRPMLRRIFEFLGVEASFADSNDITIEPSNVGIVRALPPAVESHLIGMFDARTRELAEYLGREFQIELPAAWSRLLDGGGVAASSPVTTEACSAEPLDSNGSQPDVDWHADDARLTAVLSRDDLNGLDFLSYRIVPRGPGLMAYRNSLGVLNPDDYAQDWWDQQAAAGNCVFGSNVYDIKYAILRSIVSHTLPPGSEAFRLHRLELQLEHTQRRLDEMTAVCDELSQFIPACLQSIVSKLSSLPESRDLAIQNLEGVQPDQSSTLQQEQELRQQESVTTADVAASDGNLAVADRGPRRNRLEALLVELTRKLSAWRNTRSFRLLKRMAPGIEKTASIIPLPGNVKPAIASEPGLERDAA